MKKLFIVKNHFLTLMGFILIIGSPAHSIFETEPVRLKDCEVYLSGIQVATLAYENKFSDRRGSNQVLISEFLNYLEGRVVEVSIHPTDSKANLPAEQLNLRLRSLFKEISDGLPLKDSLITRIFGRPEPIHQDSFYFRGDDIKFLDLNITLNDLLKFLDNLNFLNESDAIVKAIEEDSELSSAFLAIVNKLYLEMSKLVRVPKDIDKINNTSYLSEHPKFLTARTDGIQLAVTALSERIQKQAEKIDSLTAKIQRTLRNLDGSFHWFVDFDAFRSLVDRLKKEVQTQPYLFRGTTENMEFLSEQTSIKNDIDRMIIRINELVKLVAIAKTFKRSTMIHSKTEIIFEALAILHSNTLKAIRLHSNSSENIEYYLEKINQGIFYPKGAIPRDPNQFDLLEKFELKFSDTGRVEGHGFHFKPSESN